MSLWLCHLSSKWVYDSHPLPFSVDLKQGPSARHPGIQSLFSDAACMLIGHVPASAAVRPRSSLFSSGRLIIADRFRRRFPSPWQDLRTDSADNENLDMPMTTSRALTDPTSLVWYDSDYFRKGMVHTPVVNKSRRKPNGVEHRSLKMVTTAFSQSCPWWRACVERPTSPTMLSFSRLYLYPFPLFVSCFILLLRAKSLASLLGSVIVYSILLHSLYHIVASERSLIRQQDAHYYGITGPRCCCSACCSHSKLPISSIVMLQRPCLTRRL